MPSVADSFEAETDALPHYSGVLLLDQFNSILWITARFRTHG